VGYRNHGSWNLWQAQSAVEAEFCESLRTFVGINPFMSASVDIAINCLKVPRWSASDTSSTPSPPPWARTCVTWVSMVTASRRPRPYGGVQPGPWLSGESAEKPVGAPPPHGRGPARLRTIRLIVILALSALFVPLAAGHEWSSRVPSRAPVHQVTEDSS
jgi:hypothetical protein